MKESTNPSTIYKNAKLSTNFSVFWYKFLVFWYKLTKLSPESTNPSTLYKNEQTDNQGSDTHDASDHAKEATLDIFNRNESTARAGTMENTHLPPVTLVRT